MRATIFIKVAEDYGTVPDASVFGLPRRRSRITGSSHSASELAATKAFQSNEWRSVATRCTAASPHRRISCKRDEHYRSAFQWEIMHSPENSAGAPRFERKHAQSENKLFRILSPGLRAIALSTRPAVSQTHPFVFQPFTRFLGSFNPFRSVRPSLAEQLIFKLETGHSFRGRRRIRKLSRWLGNSSRPFANNCTGRFTGKA